MDQLLIPSTESTLPDNRLFKALTTFKAAFFLLYSTVVLGVAGVTLQFTHPFKGTCSRLVILLFGQATLWFLSLILDHYFKWRHSALKCAGHFTFFYKMNRLATLQFIVISLGNTLILCFLGIRYSYGSSGCEGDVIFSAFSLVANLIVVETVILVPLIAIYIKEAIQFNRNRPLSDLDIFECTEPSEDLRVPEVPNGEESRGLVKLLEKQSDYIRFYRMANIELSKRLGQAWRNHNSA